MALVKSRLINGNKIKMSVNDFINLDDQGVLNIIQEMLGAEKTPLLTTQLHLAITQELINYELKLEA